MQICEELVKSILAKRRHFAMVIFTSAYTVIRSQEHCSDACVFPQIHPGSVWVKKCVGLCDYYTSGSKCMPRETIIRHIPVSIALHVNTNTACINAICLSHVSLIKQVLDTL